MALCCMSYDIVGAMVGFLNRIAEEIMFREDGA